MWRRRNGAKSASIPSVPGVTWRSKTSRSRNARILPASSLSLSRTLTLSLSLPRSLALSLFSFSLSPSLSRSLSLSSSLPPSLPLPNARIHQASIRSYSANWPATSRFTFHQPLWTSHARPPRHPMSSSSTGRLRSAKHPRPWKC